MDAREGSEAVGQSLFVRRAPDGREWEFAAVIDGGCAVRCDGTTVATGDGSEEAVSELLSLFLRESDKLVIDPVEGHRRLDTGGASNYHAA